MKILVTGGTGYIGSHTVVELQQLGHEVVVVDNLSNSNRKIIDQIQLVTGIKPRFYQLDLTDKKAIHNFFQEQNDIYGIIHFAALKAVGESVEKPLLYYRNNIESLLNVIEGMMTTNIQQFVFSSSCTVYGQPEKLPVSENAPLQQAWSPYGHTKQIAEDIIRQVFPQHGLKGILLRYFNPIGAHSSALIGELPLGTPNNLVPYITQTAIGKRNMLSVFGNDYDTPDGTAIRDYIHVVDLARAHIAALNRLALPENNRPVEIFNVGTGRGYSVLEAIKAFEKVSGKTLNYKFVGRRQGDIEKVWADTALANEVLGWKAAYGLEVMMESAWKWELALQEISFK